MINIITLGVLNLFFAIYFVTISPEQLGNLMQSGSDRHCYDYGLVKFEDTPTRLCRPHHQTPQPP